MFVVPVPETLFSRLPPLSSRVPSLVTTAPSPLAFDINFASVSISTACEIVLLFVTSPIICVVPFPEISFEITPAVRLSEPSFAMVFPR